MEIGLLLLRLTVGLTLAAHGAQKLFGWFGGPGLDATGQAFEGLGFQPGRRHALMAGLVETGGGLILALGLFTPIGAAIVFSVMLVAALTVHVKQGFFITSAASSTTSCSASRAWPSLLPDRVSCRSTRRSAPRSAVRSGASLRLSSA